MRALLPLLDRARVGQAHCARAYWADGVVVCGGRVVARCRPRVRCLRLRPVLVLVLVALLAIPVLSLTADVASTTAAHRMAGSSYGAAAGSRWVRAFACCAGASSPGSSTSTARPATDGPSCTLCLAMWSRSSTSRTASPPILYVQPADILPCRPLPLRVPSQCDVADDRCGDQHPCVLLVPVPRAYPSTGCHPPAAAVPSAGMGRALQRQPRGCQLRCQPHFRDACGRVLHCQARCDQQGSRSRRPHTLRSRCRCRCSRWFTCSRCSRCWWRSRGQWRGW